MAVKLVLDNGMVFEGKSVGCNQKTYGEIIFNTSMVGYQEIMTDPTNYGKIVVMSYPLIGNYGLTDDDNQSQNIQVAGLVVHEQNENPSNFRFTTTLSETMQLNGTVGISGVDTRALVKTLANSDRPMSAIIVDSSVDSKEALNELKKLVEIGKDRNEVKEVTCKRVLYMRTRNPKYTVVVVDLGLKTSIRKELNSLACNLIVVPYDTTAQEIMKFNPDGVLFSNGPGNPKRNQNVIKLAKELRGKVPLLGLGLGFQIISLSYGLDTEKRVVSVSGSNIPVRDLDKKKVLMTSQYTSYKVLDKKIKDIKVTFENVKTKDVEGIEDIHNDVIAIQFEPNATGDGTGKRILMQFVASMEKRGGAENAKENRY